MKPVCLLIILSMFPLGIVRSAPKPAVPTVTTSAVPAATEVVATEYAALPAINAAVLQQISTMPLAGGYSASHFATERLSNAVRPTTFGLDVAAGSAQPSYCSGATYLVFLKTINALQRSGEISLDATVASALLIAGQRDGEGIWGRWNANGPGTARLFHELGIGRNFSDYSEALPGDFMKIFWTNAVGRKERGHSVVFLGTEKVNGVDSVRFWSSNVGMGYGVKVVPRSRVSYAIFSRLTAPRNILRAPVLSPQTDPYLASLLTKDSNLPEVRTLCGM